ncbi:MAG: efflux RND transporter periplasmic adaptor subunit [Candidatus Omnitrophota bacterium]
MDKNEKIKSKIADMGFNVRTALSKAGEKAGYNKWPQERKRIAGIIVLVVLFVLPFIFRGCSRQEKTGIHPRSIETALAVKKDVPTFLDSFGQMVSSGDVDIRSQVTGKILKVHFVQGEEVGEGDLLFSVDPAPYQAELDKAKALLAQNTASMRLKADTLERNKLLFEKGLISRQEIEEYQADYDSVAATVELDKANVEASLIDLEYCEIKSPVDGLTGKRLVDPGNIVSANSGPDLVNIKQIDVLYLDFTLAEKYLYQVRSAMSQEVLEVKIFVPGSDAEAVTGKLDLVDNAVDVRTGNFSLRASVDNTDRVLWPGQYVTVRLILGTEKGAIIVPYAAAKIGKQGYYVFTVGEDNLACLRQVTVGARHGEDIIIENGVAEGEVVVTLGQLGLRPGIPVVDTSKISGAGKAKGKN